MHIRFRSKLLVHVCVYFLIIMNHSSLLCSISDLPQMIHGLCWLMLHSCVTTYQGLGIIACKYLVKVGHECLWKSQLVDWVNQTKFQAFGTLLLGFVYSLFILVLIVYDFNVELSVILLFIFTWLSLYIMHLVLFRLASGNIVIAVLVHLIFLLGQSC